jgi:small GTP-binding protein
MPTIEDLIERLPDDTQKTVRSLWETLPDTDRASIKNLVEGFPSQTNLWRLLVRLSTNQIKYVMGKKDKIAIIGPANVGKSTLYNQFTQNKEDLASVSPIPGTTRVNQQAETGLFTIVDTPGADAVGNLGEKERDEAYQAASQADFIIIIFDAIQGIKKTELEIFHYLIGLNKPYIVILNKIDLVKSDQEKIIDTVASSLGMKAEQIIPTSAKNGKNLSRVLLAIAAAQPEILTALGRGLPAYRWQLAWRAIVGASSLSGVIALAPLPIIDFAPLIINQTSMVLTIARIYNYKINLQRARELVVTFGLGFLGRTLFYELSKLGGIPGWILSAAIAASTTVAMGYAAVVWFERGEKLSKDTIKKLTRVITKDLLDSLKSIGSRKDRKKLQERIAETLENIPLAEDENAFKQITEDDEQE